MPLKLSYHMLVKNSKKPEEIRHKMTERYYLLGNNASACAREFNTKRQTVKLWVDRFEQGGIEGLKDRSRAPHHIPHKLSSKQEQEILSLRDEKGWGPDNLRLNGGIDHSTSVIYRVLKQNERVKKRKRRYQKKRELAKWKKTFKALKYWQIDVKDLVDISNIWAFIEENHIPRYEYTARDVRTGTTFIAFAYEYSLLYSIRFVTMLLEHLKAYQILLEDVTIQTDNGSEFIGSVYSREDSGFSRVIEDKYFAKHVTIPVATPRFNGHVENFHGRIEVEFYEKEYLPTEHELLSKATGYIWWYNLIRKNQNTKKTPFELIKQQTNIQEKQFLDFPPVVLDNLPWFFSYLKSVPHVAEEVIMLVQSQKSKIQSIVCENSSF